MQVGTIIGFTGILIISAVVLQVALSVHFLVARNVRSARLDKARLDQFKERAATVLDRARVDRESHELSWSGRRKFQVQKRVYENPNKDVCSFYLVPHDGRPMPPFRAGQFLTFELPVPGESGPVVRCYSLSDSPTRKDHYRVSIKRLEAPPKAPKGTPPGVSSSYFHNTLDEGDIVEAFAPAGEFYIDEASERPVVFIAGGVGLTPLVSMMTWLVETNSHREVWFFYGVRNRGEHAMFEMLRRVEKENSNINVVVVYADPTDTCRKGEDYNVEGFVSVDLLKSLLKTTNYEFYICGPPPMMEAVTSGLEEWGVAQSDIRYESFGPASVKRAQAAEKPATDENAEVFQVEFSRSKKTFEWTSGAGTLLEFAEANDIKARCGCRTGSCGTCVTALMQGDVHYIHKPAKQPEAGSCLVCISQPKSDLVIDL